VPRGTGPSRPNGLPSDTFRGGRAPSWWLAPPLTNPPLGALARRGGWHLGHIVAPTGFVCVAHL